jgi:L-alanine-DL-glutamate epimerase-like enolase superfamily enzyme
MRVRIVSADVEFLRRPFVKPLRLSSGVISEITEARASVTVETDGGRTATGRGAIYLSDLWAWPDPSRTPAERDAAMRAYAVRLAAELPERTRDEPVHPLEAGLRLHHRTAADETPLPPLARLVCASPFDAALHDAAGIAAGCSAFALYSDDAPVPSADPLFVDGGAVAAIRRMLRNPPVPTLDATLVVGKGDDLAELETWVKGRGYRVFKLKVGGTDPVEDAERTVAVYREARRLGARNPRLSVDSNCLSPDAATVAAFLDVLAERDNGAFAALDYIEQPTGRDIREHAFDWRGVAARRPVLIDEGLIDFAALRTAEEQGWNGMAVKTCRGHSFSLVAAAWAFERNWTLTVMDLTNPGYAAMHSALLAAHLPGVSAIEMNAAQYTPAANDDWLPRLAPLLEPMDGAHRLPETVPVGLGTAL